MERQRRARSTIYWLMAAMAAGAIGCQGLPVRAPSASNVSAAAPAWPPPPQHPRIRFVREVHGPREWGIRPSFFERLGLWLFGPKDLTFVRPTGIAVSAGSLYVADPGAQSLWILHADRRRYHRITHAAGERLASPVAVAIGRQGQAYLADSSRAQILVFEATGRLRHAIHDARFRRPSGVAYDAPRDRLYVADSAAHTVWVLRGDGQPIGSIGRRGTGAGAFNFPTHLALDREGMLYVTDALGFRVQFFSSDGIWRGVIGRHGDRAGDFAMPKGVAVDREGHLYVAEALFDAVQLFDRNGQFLLSFGEQGRSPGQFWLPGGLWMDAQDRLYVADAYNQRIQLFQYVPAP
jgi:sugar lactone lactonase YvrE